MQASSLKAEISMNGKVIFMQDVEESNLGNLKNLCVNLKELQQKVNKTLTSLVENSESPDDAKCYFDASDTDSDASDLSKDVEVIRKKSKLSVLFSPRK